MKLHYDLGDVANSRSSIFSLFLSVSLFVKVNLKLSDYGIACFSTPSGLTQSVGTAGYRAPELLISNSSNMPYYDKVRRRWSQSRCALCITAVHFHLNFTTITKDGWFGSLCCSS